MGRHDETPRLRLLLAAQQQSKAKSTKATQSTKHTLLSQPSFHLSARVCCLTRASFLPPSFPISLPRRPSLPIILMQGPVQKP